MPVRCAALFISLSLLSACASQPESPKSGLELQAYQAREFDTAKRTAFSATMSVFQDLGFIIDDGDFDTGLITASGPTISTQGMPDWLEILLSGQSTTVSKRRRATAFVEAMPSGLIRVRLNFVFATQNGANSASVITEPIHDPELYQKTFAEIDKAIFVRTQGS